MCKSVDSNVLLISLASTAKVIQSFQFRVMKNGVAAPVLYAEMGEGMIRSVILQLQSV